MLISVTDGWGFSCEIAHRWMPLDLTDDKSTLVKVMAWCRQAISHYLSWCWPRCMSSYGVTRPRWAVSTIQYTPRNMHTVFTLLCFVVVIHWLTFPYPSGLLHWHCGNLTIVPSASKATLMNMDKYFMWIHYEWLHNHNKAKHNKTVCIFLGIYCTSVDGFDFQIDFC